MILFFHFICLLARYIVLNISKSISKKKINPDENPKDEAVKNHTFAFFRNKKEYVELPTYECGTLKFFPPVYVQRYETVAIILKEFASQGLVRKVVDFGCAELGFFMYLKFIEGVNEILEVDIDEEILQRYSFKAAPLTSDYLMSKCKKPLDVYILAGSIEDYDDCLAGTDTVVAIEVIEHLSEEAFTKMPYNIFHQIKPKIAIFTTPNADFNSLFPNFTNVRHSDHRFEWTRKEFFTWTQEIINKYCEYSVKFYGIGAGPEGTENLGCCSQMAVFIRADDILAFDYNRHDLKRINNYKLINHYKYPVFHDRRTTEEKILHEIQYHLSHIIAMPNYYNYDYNESEIPLSILKQYVNELCSNDEEIRNILTNNGMKIKFKNGSWYLVCIPSDFNSPDHSSSEYLKDEEWLNEETGDYNSNKEKSSSNENWGVNDHQNEDTNNFHSARSLLDLDSNKREETNFSLCNNVKECCTEVTEGEPDSTSEIFDQYSRDENTGLFNHFDNKKGDDTGKGAFVKSKIPRKKNLKQTEEEFCGFDFRQKLRCTNVCNPKRQNIFRSCSLDSSLKGVEYRADEHKSYYLNLIPGDTLIKISSLSHNINKQVTNTSGSSLLSSSLDRAADSGYPISCSPHDADLTPEQVDELVSENEMMSRSSSSASSGADMSQQRLHVRILHNFFAEGNVVENWDLVNNNRDGEGNNVQGLLGEGMVNELIARDPNDNMMFFPEIEEFPPWLLNLGGLA